MKLPYILLIWLSTAIFPLAHQANAKEVFDENTDSINADKPSEEDILADSLYRVFFPKATEYGPDTSFIPTTIEPTRSVLPEHVLNTSVPDTGPMDWSSIAGVIPIEGSVTPTGARTYSVPLEVPQGIAGFTPQLALVYNSMAGQGIVGMGWNVSGLSTITRGNKSVYYDGATSGMSMTADDAFYLDGMRLISIGSNSYETEQGNIRITAHTSGSIVQYFDVKYPDGRTCVYGYSSNGSKRLCYPVKRMEDVYGNSMEFTYTYSNNHYKIDRIVYNGNRIQFSYLSRSDAIDRYCNGLSLGESYLLSSITCYIGSNVLRTYTLSYTVKDGNSMLTSIGCEGADGTVLNPLSFYYGTGYKANIYNNNDLYLSQGYYTPYPDKIGVVEGRFDYYNGVDGLVVYPIEYPYFKYDAIGQTFQFFLNKYDGDERIFAYCGMTAGSTPYLSPEIYTEEGFVDIFCADIEGRQFEDVIKVNNTVVGNTDEVRFKIYEPTANSSLAYDRTVTFQDNTIHTDHSGHKSIQPKFYYSGDYDGDGRMEVLAISVDKPFGNTNLPSKCYVYDLRNGTIKYQGNLLTFNKEFVSNSTSSGDVQDILENQTDQLFPIDYDGDGKTDLIHINSTGLHIYTFDVTSSGLSGRLVSSYSSINRTALEDRKLLAGDVNGDGLMDFLISPEKGNPSTQWKIYKNKGNGNFVYNTKTGPTYANKQEFYTHDINADGKSELISKIYEILQTYSLDGSNMQLLDTEFLPSDSTKFITTSISSRNYTAKFMTLRNRIATLYSFDKNFSRDGLLTGMANSLRLVEKTQYETISEPNSSFYNRGTNAEFPFVNMVEEMPVVVAHETYLDGNGQDMTCYQYSNAVMHRQGRGFTGFGSITTINSNGLQTLNTYEPYGYGQLLSSISPSERVFCEYDTNLQTDRRVKVLLTEKREENLLTGFNSTTTYQYDSYGFPTNENIVFSDGITRSTENLYLHKDTDSFYKLGTVKRCEKTVSKGNDSHEETEQVISFNSEMSAVRKRWKVDGNTVKNEHYEYDNNGNVTCVDVTAYNSNAELSTDYEYDGYGRLTLVSDPLGNETVYSYDTLGRVASKTDKYGVTTECEYDGFGRITLETNPLTSDKSTSYDRTYGALRVNISQDYHSNQYTVYDGLGREAQKTIMQLSGRAYTEKEYDEYGRLSRESLPHFISGDVLWKEFTYDDYDRLLSVTEPSGNTTTYVYSGNEVTTTKDGVTTTRIYNSQGQLTQVVDDGGTVTYNLDADGKPSSVTAPGNITTTFTYDGYRRRTSMTDPSLGTVSYTYDDAGNTSSSTNAKGETINYEYDYYNRLVSKSMPEMEFTYTYNNKSDIVSIGSDNGTSKAYTYDNYGRMASVTAHANDSIWLKKEFTYNTFGRLYSTKYTSQNGELCTESYEYSTSGWKNKNKRDLAMFYHQLSGNAFGQPYRATSGSLNREWEYTPEGLVSEIYAQQNNNDLLYLEYTYDEETKNLVRYDDYIHGFIEEYDYDDLNRLVEYGEKTVSYDNLGNITSKNGSGDYSYNGSIPYAVSRVTGQESSFDFTYTSFYRPDSIIGSLCSNMFIYDENYERVCMESHRRNTMVYGQPLTETVTYKFYLGDCYETEGPGGIEWLYLNGDYYTATSVLRKQGNTKTLYHIVRDRLGSVRLLVDASGTIVCEKDFDAWGNKRTHDGYTFANSVSFDRGFCGHEHVRGYINMNARLYDSFTGTFISPDPFVQAPDNSQNFNRYSYCLNNPLKYVDRNGKVFWLVPILVGAAIGAGISGTTYAVTAMINKSWNPHAFTKALGMGAFSGALGGAIGLVGSSLGQTIASSANKFAFNLLSQTTNSIATNAVFGGNLSFKSVLGITAGAAIGTLLPNFKAIKGGGLVNALAETGFNTARGAITGLGQGFVNAALYKDANYIWQNAVGGAISGFSRSLFMNAIFGAQYDSSAKGYYRQGGLADFALKAYQFIKYGNLNIKGYGLTLGNHMYIPTGDEKTMMHESMHIEQQESYGWATFYALDLFEYAKYGFHGAYHHKGSLEWNAENGLGW